MHPECSLYECGEAGMGAIGPGLELRMELHSKEEWMAWYLYSLNKASIGACPCNPHPILLELSPVLIGEFVSVPVALGDAFHSVRLLH